MGCGSSSRCCRPRAAEAALGLTGEERVLLVNGGAYQDVGQLLHFHLAVGAEGFRFSSSGEAGSVELLEGGRVEAFARPKAGWAAHLVVRATEPGATLGDAATAMALFGAAQRLARERGLERDGFAVVQTRSPAGDEAALPARRLGRRAAIT